MTLISQAGFVAELPARECGRASPVAAIPSQQAFGHKGKVHSMTFACQHATFQRVESWLTYLTAFAGDSGIRVSASGEEDSMPRRKSLLTIIRDLVQQEVRATMQLLLGTFSTAPRAKNGRRRRTRRRSLRRPPGSKSKAA
jgi:hypothetical protein